MLIVVSPAKALDFESKLATKKQSEPRMLDRSVELIDLMRTKSVDDIADLMSISPALAELNFVRYHDWDPAATPAGARPAILAFNGDTYVGLDARASFGERDFTHAQKTLRILSGLYGVLRPLDLIQPYRLEMGTKLANPSGPDLAAFWGDTITDQLNRDLHGSPGPAVVLNLASKEYFGAVHPDDIEGRIITPRFLDRADDGEYRSVGFLAKQARGTMAGWLIRERFTSVRPITRFRGMGYVYDAGRSEPDQPVFIR